MKVYSGYRAFLGYLFVFLAIIFVAGCSGSDSPPGNNDNNNSQQPPNEPPVSTKVLDIVADTGSIVAVRVGEPATLDGSNSYTQRQGALTYAWSFTTRPDGSNADLQNATTVSPSFVPDVRGSYRVQLVVSDDVGSSERAIALVEATNTGERPTGPFVHMTLSSNCANCHNDSQSTVVSKSADHVATTNLCQACHTTFGFDIVLFTDHDEIFGNCSECHNGVLAVGKSEYHVQTTVECDDCHNTTSFLELGPDGSYDHASISRPCVGCHNNVIAIGKFVGHPQSSDQCNRCHTTEAFSPVYFDHDGVDFAVTPCVSCHDSNNPDSASSVGKTPNHPATSDNCQLCHETTTFVISGTFNHDVLDDEPSQCVTCHDGNHVAAGARGMTDTVIHTNATAGGVDCGNCHNTDDFAQNFVDHTSDAVTLNRCDSCHNGTDAIGVPSPNHIDLTTGLNSGDDCNVCHTPGNFATGFYDHTTVEADLTMLCSSCHDDVITVGKIGNHIPTTDDCRVCHNTTTFVGATVDHTNITNGCETCHDGNSSTGKGDATPTHIPTTDDCNVCHTTDPLVFSPSTFLTGAHTTITSDCQSCHGTYATGKPRRTHIPTTDDCSTCHVTSSFVGATFDHTGVDRGCEGCHNGRFTTDSGTILGKPTNPDNPNDMSLHVPTEQDCYFCHNTSDWLTSVQTVFAHTDISGNCTSCHNGDYVAMGALAKTSVASGHPNTNADCGACHTTSDVPPNGLSFLNYFVDHTGIVDNCGSSGCHDRNTNEGIIAQDPQQHGPSNGNDCHLCHTAGAGWIPAVFDHSNVTRTTRCDSCHNGTDATGTAAKTNPPHIPLNNNEDCRLCHNTESFAGATFDHQGITGNCAQCHNGDTATGKPQNHVPTNGDCVECHQTTGFIPATFDHTGIVDNCQSCHDGVLATGKVDAVNHVQTDQDCSVCHSTTAFSPAQFDHTGIVDNCARSGCHGDGATGKPLDHLQTSLDCSNCHTTTTFVGGSWVHDSSTAGRCLDCHVTGGGATPQPTTGHFDTGGDVQCDACHTTNGWGDQGTYRHTGRDYPGDHRRGKTSCTDCHRSNSASPVTYPNDPQYAPDCAGCHAGDFRSEGDHIGGRNGTVSQNRDCGQSGCHRVSSSGF